MRADSRNRDACTICEVSGDCVFAYSREVPGGLVEWLLVRRRGSQAEPSDRLAALLTTRRNGLSVRSRY
jgi:hypothetical protein